MDDARRHELTARQISRARTLAERLDPNVFESVLQYGLYAQVRLAGIADEVLTRLDLSAEDRNRLVRLIARLGRLDPARPPRNPFARLVPAFRRGPRHEDALFDRYERMCDRLDRMLPRIEAGCRQIGETLTAFDELFERNQSYLDELDVLIHGARLRLEALQGDVLPQLMRETDSARKSDRIDQLSRQAERIEQRIADLEASADTARDTGPTIRRIQDDLRGLQLTAQHTTLNTATRWKHRFADAVTRTRQRETAAAAGPAPSAQELEAAPERPPEPHAGPVAVPPALAPADEPAPLPPANGWIRRLRALATLTRTRPDVKDELDPSRLWWG